VGINDGTKEKVAIKMMSKDLLSREGGKLKRKINKSVNPLYGKKGMGLINNPKKALYNKVYKKTSFSLWDLIGKMLK
jgi:hypothetical protein